MGSAPTAPRTDLVGRTRLDPRGQAGQFRRTEADFSGDPAISAVPTRERDDDLALLGHVELYPRGLPARSQFEGSAVQSQISAESHAQEPIEPDLCVRIPDRSVAPRTLAGPTDKDRGGVPPDDDEPIHHSRDHRCEDEQDDDTENNLDGSRHSVQPLSGGRGRG